MDAYAARVMSGEGFALEAGRLSDLGSEGVEGGAAGLVSAVGLARTAINVHLAHGKRLKGRYGQTSFFVA